MKREKVGVNSTGLERSSLKLRFDLNRGEKESFPLGSFINLPTPGRNLIAAINVTFPGNGAVVWEAAKAESGSLGLGC